MKTIEEWRKIFGLEYDPADDGKSILQAIRDEAFDVAIEAMKELNVQNIWDTKFSKPFTREQAITAIEELKEK